MDEQTITSTAKERFSTVYLARYNDLAAQGILPAGKGQKMLDSIIAGTASIDGPACKATCKALGIKNTYKALREFFAQDALQ